jgi:hypothetical protein
VFGATCGSMRQDKLARRKNGTAALVIAALFAAALAGAAVAAVRTNLVISGAVNTTSGRAVAGTSETCGFKSGTLSYMSAAMRVGRGPAVARVEFFIPHYRGPQRYDAKAPAPYSRTAVQVVMARNAATGAASGFYIATRGSVSVTPAHSVRRQGRRASVRGNVHAKLRLQRGSRRLSLDGTWSCHIAPEANGRLSRDRR